jgi:hypothetical protein
MLLWNSWYILLCTYVMCSFFFFFWKKYWLEKTDRATKTSLFDRNWAISLKPRRTSHPLRLVYMLNPHLEYLREKKWFKKKIEKKNPWPVNLISLLLLFRAHQTRRSGWLLCLGFNEIAQFLSKSFSRVLEFNKMQCFRLEPAAGQIDLFNPISGRFNWQLKKYIYCTFSARVKLL